ncbi:hypothetical protein LF599_02300 [Pseudodesulfovibrio thermohalotolerans]|uniref:hypothetical protein n=1 Tax=Pseudodesulfovibrio thermohalotolerans TaxID=2880651 RepID=UPI002442EAE6|nr:hypothetical protein [Pseudodesulfovibrio thermohalotolerans]WFS63010.1 hypothetical protein LF599_02300 [Pseudodesulfovibrio thermohalotolerans]
MHKFFVYASLAVFLTGAFFAASVRPAWAQDLAAISPGDASTPVRVENMPAFLDTGLATKKADFTRFARSRAKSLDRNHCQARSRMQITQQPDGSYLARFHAIDMDSIVTNVRRSKSKTVPFVGVMRFCELVMEAKADSPDACRAAEFTAVTVIPNRQIFSYKKGSWQ